MMIVEIINTNLSSKRYKEFDEILELHKTSNKLLNNRLTRNSKCKDISNCGMSVHNWLSAKGLPESSFIVHADYTIANIEFNNENYRNDFLKYANLKCKRLEKDKYLVINPGIRIEEVNKRILNICQTLVSINPFKDIMDCAKKVLGKSTSGVSLNILDSDFTELVFAYGNDVRIKMSSDDKIIIELTDLNKSRHKIPVPNTKNYSLEELMKLAKNYQKQLP